MPPPPPPLFSSPSGIACQPVVRNPLSIKDTTFTSAATKVNDLGTSTTPHIKRCDEIWERLEGYIDLNPAVQHPITTSECHANFLPKRNTDPISWRRATALLHAEQTIVMSRRPAPMTSTASARDEGNAQIMGILRAAIETRYANRALDLLPDQTAPDYQESSGAQSTDHVFYPNWIATCPALHQDPLALDNAGFSDFILSKFPDKTGNAAVVEFKPFWSYSSKAILENYFHKPQSVLQPGLDMFRWNKSSAPSELMKQIYGELVFMGVDIAFFSNCEICFVAVLTEEKDEEPTVLSPQAQRAANRSGERPKDSHPVLVLSAPRRWTDPNLHAALTGLTFLAIDIDDWGKTVAELLCPIGTRRSLRFKNIPETEKICQEYGL